MHLTPSYQFGIEGSTEVTELYNWSMNHLPGPLVLDAEGQDRPRFFDDSAMDMETKKTVVIGATEKPDRYANRAAHSLMRHGHPVELVGLRPGTINGQPIKTGQPELEQVDTVTMYVGPRNQPALYDYIKRLKPRRVIFNPGTENTDFERQLRQAGIEPVEACTLVMLSVGTY